ncbi:MAG: hypothetical protein ACPIOQ_58620, partial [Promethearchaeia archaeon]
VHVGNKRPAVQGNIDLNRPRKPEDFSLEEEPLKSRSPPATVAGGDPTPVGRASAAAAAAVTAACIVSW